MELLQCARAVGVGPDARRGEAIYQGRPVGGATGKVLDEVGEFHREVAAAGVFEVDDPYPRAVPEGRRDRQRAPTVRSTGRALRCSTTRSRRSVQHRRFRCSSRCPSSRGPGRQKPSRRSVSDRQPGWTRAQAARSPVPRAPPVPAHPQAADPAPNSSRSKARQLRPPRCRYHPGWSRSCHPRNTGGVLGRGRVRQLRPAEAPPTHAGAHRAPNRHTA